MLLDVIVPAYCAAYLLVAVVPSCDEILILA